MKTKQATFSRRIRGWLAVGLLALAAAALGSCAVMGVNTRTLEAKPLVQAYERLGGEAEETRSQAVGCPSCVY